MYIRYLPFSNEFFKHTHVQQLKFIHIYFCMYVCNVVSNIYEAVVYCINYFCLIDVFESYLNMQLLELIYNVKRLDKGYTNIFNYSPQEMCLKL